MSQAKFMYNSLSVDRRPPSIGLISENNNKLWKSDLHKFKTGKEKV